MIEIKKEKYKFKNLKEFYLGSNGDQYITIPIGFGIKNEEKFKTINLENFEDIKCPVFNTMLKENIIKFNHYKHKKSKSYKIKTIISPISLRLYEQYLFFVSIIYRFYNYKNNLYGINHLNYSDSDVVLPTVFFSTMERNKNSLFEQMLGMSNGNLIAMLRFFQKYKFLEMVEEAHSWVDYSIGEKRSDKKARQFLVSEQFYRYPYKYKIRNKFLIEKINLNFEKKFHEMLDCDEEVSFEKSLLTEDNISSFEFPGIEEVMEKAKTMVENKERDRFGRTYVFGIPLEWMHEDNGKKFTVKKKDGGEFTYTMSGKIKKDCPYVDINIHIKNYYIVMEGQKTMKRRKKYEQNRESYYDRYYYTLSMIPKWIRQMITIDGEEIVECDYTALHPRLLGKMFEEKTGIPCPDVLKGDAHSKIAEELKISRKEAKLINLKYFNSRMVKASDGSFFTLSNTKDAEKFKKMDFLMKRLGVFEYLLYNKVKRKSIKNRNIHSNMSAMMIDKEVRLMNDVIKRFNGTLIYVYDAVYVKKSEANKMLDLMKISFS